MYRQEYINVAAPIGTRKQVRMAAKNRGITPDELARDILLIGVNRLSGGTGQVEPEIPKHQFRALEKEKKDMQRDMDDLVGNLTHLEKLLEGLLLRIQMAKPPPRQRLRLGRFR